MTCGRFFAPVSTDGCGPQKGQKKGRGEKLFGACRGLVHAKGWRKAASPSGVLCVLGESGRFLRLGKRLVLRPHLWICQN